MIDPVTTATTAPRPADTPSPRGLTSDFETFLRMLTTQMQNQDPLNPMEASDFAVQLATFSGVEQAVRTNQLLESLLAQSGLGELAGLVGLAVRAPGPAQFDGSGIALTLPRTDSGDSARLIVRDALGQVVDTTQVPMSGGNHVWRGLGPDGMPLPNGSYSFEVAGFLGDQPTGVTAPAETHAEVIEARRDPAGTRLLLADGRDVALDSVTALRAPR